MRPVAGSARNADRLVLGAADSRSHAAVDNRVGAAVGNWIRPPVGAVWRHRWLRRQHGGGRLRHFRRPGLFRVGGRHLRRPAGHEQHESGGDQVDRKADDDHRQIVQRLDQDQNAERNPQRCRGHLPVPGDPALAHRLGRGHDADGAGDQRPDGHDPQEENHCDVRPDEDRDAGQHRGHRQCQAPDARLVLEFGRLHQPVVVEGEQEAMEHQHDRQQPLHQVEGDPRPQEHRQADHQEQCTPHQTGRPVAPGHADRRLGHPGVTGGSGRTGRLRPKTRRPVRFRRRLRRHPRIVAPAATGGQRVVASSPDQPFTYEHFCAISPSRTTNRSTPLTWPGRSPPQS